MKRYFWATYDQKLSIVGLIECGSREQKMGCAQKLAIAEGSHMGILLVYRHVIEFLYF